ncbi:hypothetical protein K9L97_06080 [Candidatus Woesearchaeota archaeon]|nr:hypothetical protein [Candidatus Woesearchaeota archaeon]
MSSGLFKLVVNALKQPISMFMLGVFVASFLISFVASVDANNGSAFVGNVIGLDIQYPVNGNRNIDSPSDYLKENQIRVYSDRVVIEAKDIQWAAFADTKSMLPMINKDSNALQIVPDCPSDIYLGDVVSYKSDYAPGIIIHRVIKIDEDSKGTYFILKGDNNPNIDPGKIRCEQIQRKLIGVLY